MNYYCTERRIQVEMNDHTSLLLHKGETYKLNMCENTKTNGREHSEERFSENYFALLML